MHEHVRICCIGTANWYEPASPATWAFLFESSWLLTSILSEVGRDKSNKIRSLVKQASSIAWSIVKWWFPKEILVLLVFVREIYRKICQAVLGPAVINGSNDNSFIG